MPETQDTRQPDVVVTRPFIGLLYMQVCAHKDVPPPVAEDAANRENPSGTSGGWHIITEQNAETDEQKPVACVNDPDRLHYLLVC